MADENETNALMDWFRQNPEAANMGMGFLKSMQEQPRQQAQAANEIAKSQYGYLLGQGGGDMSRVGNKTMADRMIGGYLSGAAQRQGDEMNEKILKILSPEVEPSRPGSVKGEVGTQKPFQELIGSGVIKESTASPESWSEALNRAKTSLGAPRGQDRSIHAIDFNANPAPAKKIDPSLIQQFQKWNKERFE